MAKINSDYTHHNGMHLHNNITPAKYTWAGRFRNVGALISTKSEKPSITIEGEFSTYDHETGNYNYVPFRKEFFIGDTVEIGSYNLIYTAPISKLGAKTVTTEKDGEVKRFDLVEFIKMNHDFDFDRITAANVDTMYYI